MRTVNLRSVIIANSCLSSTQRDELYKVWRINPKLKELATLDLFLKQCDTLAPYEPELITSIADTCYFGFKIPRISKEMDCLWIGEDTIVNVELKSEDVGAEAIGKQLRQNKYYLRPLKRKILSFTYEASSRSCYSLDDNENLVGIPFKDIATALLDVHKEILFEGEIETLFSPEQYLVSPFNSTAEFLEGKYFLNNQQQDIKNIILKFVATPSYDSFFALTGGPGTGKSLLLYDMAKTLMESGKRVVIGHAGGLNNGHSLLNQQGWHIKATKNLWKIDADRREIKMVDADVYMIDEAQRCFNFESILNEVAKTGKKCILSFDAEQTMSNEEQFRDNANKIMTVAGCNSCTLSSNIRTNEAVYGFVKALFDKRGQIGKDIRGNVEISYCQSYGEAVSMLLVLQKKGYKIPKFTPKQYGGREEYESWFPLVEPSAHEVIGQEFDNVASILSDKMYYDANGKLVSSGRYLYREDKMLYQILSRARNKIHLVIVNNPAMLERCVKLMKK